jgi:hypothetical protein
MTIIPPKRSGTLVLPGRDGAVRGQANSFSKTTSGVLQGSGR